MIRSAASKVMWVGRATVFLVGLAVILALLFGAASTVSAHTGNKGFFHLGHQNVSGAVSTLGYFDSGATHLDTDLTVYAFCADV